jgi:hypothetical protein
MASARTANFASSAAKLSTNSSISRVGTAVARSNSPSGTPGAKVSQLGRSSATKTVQTASFKGAPSGVKKFDAAGKFAKDKKFEPMKPGKLEHGKYADKFHDKHHDKFYDKFHHGKDWWWGKYGKWPSYDYCWPYYGCYYPSYSYCYPSWYTYCYPTCYYPQYTYCYPSYCYPSYCYPSYCYPEVSFGCPPAETPAGDFAPVGNVAAAN